MIRWFRFRIKTPERVKCDECLEIVKGKNKEPFVWMYGREAIREDYALDQIICQKCMEKKNIER